MRNYEIPNRNLRGDYKMNWISAKDHFPPTEQKVWVRMQSKLYSNYKTTTCAAHIGYHERTTEDNGWEDSEINTEYDEENDCFWIPECWYEVNEVDDNLNWILDDEYEITYWMKLPEPPENDIVVR